ncbi:MAG: OmpA family protein [Actinomycetota bacterium]
MKLPFGSRGPDADDVDHGGDGYDDGQLYDAQQGYADDRQYPQPESPRRLVVDDPAQFSDEAFEERYGTVGGEPVGYEGLETGEISPRPSRGRSRSRRRGRGRGRRSGGGVSADEFSDQLERLRSEALAEQRSAWAYLGVLSSMFALLALFGYGCSDQGQSDVATGEAAEVAQSGQPSQIVLRVDGNIITLEGAVPTEVVVGQLVAAAQGAYGAENVIDELVIDESTTFEAGTIRTVGSAMLDDPRPQALHDAVSRDFGLANRGFEVGFVETMLSPVSVRVAVEGDQVALSGIVPDQQSADDLVSTAANVWGVDNVDISQLAIGESTWSGGRISLSGNALSNDTRPDQFLSSLNGRFAPDVTADTAGLVVEDVTAVLVEVERQISELVTANPIQFEPLSADIDPSSDSVLIQLAGLIGPVPGDFEVVGHTDSVGDEQENLLLSQERAQAVVDRLVELGVDVERMTSRGEGEANPIADNTTDEGKALNRRIEFVFVGLADLTSGEGATDTESDDTTTTTEP